MEHTQAQLILANNAVLLTHTRKTFKTVTCFKLYHVCIKEINFKKKAVNIGSGKVQSKPSIFTAPSFMEPVKTSTLENALRALLNNKRKTFFFLKLSSPKSTILTTQLPHWHAKHFNTTDKPHNFRSQKHEKICFKWPLIFPYSSSIFSVCTNYWKLHAIFYTPSSLWQKRKWTTVLIKRC